MHACKGCGKKFKLLAHARRHELYHNPNDHRRKHECSMCDKRFLYKGDLQRHFESCHSDKKPFKCRVCTFRAASKEVIVEHERKHGMKPARFHCVSCNLSCVDEKFFREHLKEVHGQSAEIALDAPNVEMVQFSNESPSVEHAAGDNNVAFTFTE